MPTVTQSLLSLFDNIQARIDDQGAVPMNIVCAVAEDVVAWSKSVDLLTMDSTPTNILSQMMSLVSAGMTGKSEDAHRSLCSIKAALPILKRGLRRVIAKAA